MWKADNWKDYEVLDTGNGEKLERWGEYLLVRPDPQVIWDIPRKAPGWKKKNGHYHRSSKGGGEWEFFNLPEEWSIHYGALQLQAYRAVSRTGGELGLVLRHYPQFETSSEGAQSVRLYRRRHSQCCQSRSKRHPCGRIQGNGFLGKRKRSGIRSFRRTDPLAGR